MTLKFEQVLIFLIFKKSLIFNLNFYSWPLKATVACTHQNLKDNDPEQTLCLIIGKLKSEDNSLVKYNTSICPMKQIFSFENLSRHTRQMNMNLSVFALQIQINLTLCSLFSLSWRHNSFVLFFEGVYAFEPERVTYLLPVVK